jgi:hypothetical protein
MIKLRVRMYKGFLGDCFLLTFGEDRAHMLIDCGAIAGTEGVAGLMQAVAKDILKSTKGTLDVLVATHEHWDHLSGFLQARDFFEQISVKNVWLAWTEDPNDETAGSLRNKRDQSRRAIDTAIARSETAGLQLAERLDSLMGFFREKQGAPVLEVSGCNTTQDAMNWVGTRPGARIHYRAPGEKPIQLDGIEGVRIYVLGPPKDLSLLKRDLPSKRNPETYELKFAGGLEKAFLCAATAKLKEAQDLSIEEDDQIQRGEPFDRYYQIQEGTAKTIPFFQNHYGFGNSARDSQDWRRIDDDWLAVAEQLALQLDSDTNNTSLVLAIELVQSGKVLLFAADAQVGNWLSWNTLSWSLPTGNGDIKTVTTADLLQRTVLYKVGHHGSHNATLRENGLELMSSPELVALVPVDQEMAKKKHWNMPFPALARRLDEKTAGRILRSDGRLAAANSSGDGTGWKAFYGRVSESPENLYFDIELSG